MVFTQGDDGKSGWYEPPYNWEEEMEFYRRMSPKPGTPMTIYRGPRRAADKPAQGGKERPGCRIAKRRTACTNIKNAAYRQHCEN